MKKLFFSLLLLLSIGAKAQNLAFGYNYILQKATIYLTNSPTNQVGNRYELATALDSNDFYIRSANFRLRTLRYDMGLWDSIKTIVVAQDSGWMRRASIWGVIDTTNTMASKVWVGSRGFLGIGTTTSNIPEGSRLYYTDARARTALSAGTGIGFNSSTGVITNTAPDQTVSISAGTGISVGGLYPNFTVTNTGVTSVGLSSTDFSVSGSPVTSAGTITANLNTSGVSAGTYERVTVNTKGIVTAGANPSWADVTRTINSTPVTYTISSTQTSSVMYYITIACTATIGSAASGQVLFQWSTNGGSTWNDGGVVANSNTVTLAVVLNSVNSQTSCLSWDGIPANALCRLVPTSSGANTTITWVRGREKTY